MTFEEWWNPKRISEDHNDVVTKAYCRKAYQAGQAESRELVAKMREALVNAQGTIAYMGYVPLIRVDTAITEADKFLGKGGV